MSDFDAPRSSECLPSGGLDLSLDAAFLESGCLYT